MKGNQRGRKDEKNRQIGGSGDMRNKGQNKSKRDHDLKKGFIGRITVEEVQQVCKINDGEAKKDTGRMKMEN